MTPRFTSRVSIDDLHIAIAWLHINEGAEDQPACERVAAWLESEIRRRDERSAVRSIARETCRSAAEVRTAIAERGHD